MDITALKKSIADDEAKLAEKKQQLATARQEQKTAKIAEIKESIKDFELTQYDLFEAPKKARKTAIGKVSTRPAMYQSKDGTQTSTGRGKPPKWFSDYLAAGGKKEDLLIKA
jgi:DNA-binding protein H-NS